MAFAGPRDLRAAEPVQVVRIDHGKHQHLSSHPPSKAGRAIHISMLAPWVLSPRV